MVLRYQLHFIIRTHSTPVVILIYVFILLHFYYHYVLFSYLQILQVLCAWTYHHGTHIGTTRLVRNR